MRFLQISVILLFAALIGNLLKPLYWDRLEDMLRKRSDFGQVPGTPTDTTGESGTGMGFVTEKGFVRFRSEVRERYARASDLDRLKQGLQVNGEGDEALRLEVTSERARGDSLSRTVAGGYPNRATVDSLLGGFVRQERFVALQAVVQGLHRAERGGGMAPTPAGRPVFRRRNLWKGYHQVHPPYAMKAGGGR